MLRGLWAPFGILAVGCILNFSVSQQRVMELREPLTALPTELASFQGQDVPINPKELKVAGTSSALMRVFSRDSTGFSVYVGYYRQQRQGSTIHSPKNCLPGAGWEPLTSRRVDIPTEAGLVKANRFIIAKKNERALVYYWYQGRGRTESNEYQVKLDLIRDAALKRRSEEALIRILVPLNALDESGADALVRQIINELKPKLGLVFPA